MISSLEELRATKAIIDKVKKDLIKKFEINGKVVEIYRVDKNYDYPHYKLPLD